LLESVRVAPHQGISGKVLATGASLLVSDLETDERVAQKQRPRYRTKSFISLPLKLNHRTIGVLNVSDKISGEVFSAEDLERLSAVATYASVVIERGTYYRKAGRGRHRGTHLRRISKTRPARPAGGQMAEGHRQPGRRRLSGGCRQSGGSDPASRYRPLFRQAARQKSGGGVRAPLG